MSRSTNSQPTQGVPQPARTANKSGAGAVVAASSGDTVIITDILASVATTLSTEAAGGGAIVAYVPAGAVSLNQAIPVPTSSGVFSSAGNVTVNYYII
tara:strand:- start:4560 stop:4853 length:294 start_codon:yes stop_codon:yes gene_type:complete